MESVVESDDIDKAGRVGEADLVGKVPREILVLLKGSHVLDTAEVEVAVDASGNGERLGDAVERVLERGLPVLGLLHARLVRGGKLGVVAADVSLAQRGEGTHLRAATAMTNWVMGCSVLADARVSREPTHVGTHGGSR